MTDLRSWLTANNYTYRSFGDKMGVTASMAYYWAKNGIRKTDRALAVSEMTGIPVDVLAKGESS